VLWCRWYTPDHRFMKILLVHPDDSVETGPWTETKWDLVVDLGWSGRNFYSQQAERFGCSMLSIFDLSGHEQHRRQLQELLSVGLGQVVDSESIDWWETVCGFVYEQIEQVMCVSNLAELISPQSEIVATRPNAATKVLSLLLKRDFGSFAAERKPNLGVAARRYVEKAIALQPWEIMEIALDKWDTDYRLRRMLTHSHCPLTTPAVLLPSAYVNVSRAQLAYAQMLPQRRFLLVVTRHSGRRVPLPANVELRSLAAYAPGRSSSTESERVCLLRKWHRVLQERFAPNHLLGVAARMGVFDKFDSFLRNGLRIRDAWREVLTREPITAVLSADENNAFTRLPVALARARNIRTVFCDHGALNLSLGIRKICSDIYLAAGAMARDYMVEWCGLPADRIVIGAPEKMRRSYRSGSDEKPENQPRPENDKRKDWIVFFSEQYELSSARTQTLYSELLPELCSLARPSSRKVIVKLHPFESYRMRRAMIDRVLSAEEKNFVEVRQGAMTPDLFERGWFSVTVESSVAVESTTNGVPCFLCRWFDGSWYDYAAQYVKYSAGYPINSPREIRGIPHILEQIKITETTRRALKSCISPEHLESVLCGAAAD
jgi:hypothetical protein